MKRWVLTPAMDEMATMAPPPLRATAAPACLKVRNVPVRLVPMMASHSSSDVVMIGPRPPRPAAATTRSSPAGPLPTAADTAASTWASSTTSQGTEATDTPAGARASSSATATARRSGLRPAMVTEAPSSTRRRAHSRPMPEPPPVMKRGLPGQHRV